MKLTTLALLTATFATTAMAAPLKLETYNPQENGIFPVSSTLVSGPHEAVLFDAQFNVKDGEKLVEMVRKSGKKLTQIVITSGDPDFYFGLEPLVKAFPEAKIVATQKVVDHIKETSKAKLTYWGPQMKDGAPQVLYTPQPIASTHFSIDGKAVEIKQPESYAAYVWIPGNKTILGGTGVASGIHVWTADTQSVESRKDWRETLKGMAALHPQKVIPGHYLGELPQGDKAITFTSEYLTQFEQALKSQKTAAGVIATMKQQYPQLKEESSLELSAKVNKGEMAW
ncbi:Vmh family MBL fold metallo-hydrolase [Yokenella regensburgei]|uniref:Vmh family MBL fold metallo-hydrolase n=1 Tax=Yokenella regensburgei TaxID=158877 RepID=UPI003EDB0822